MAHRPLSPHVFIYRFAYTMATSIFHRITGVALSLGLLLLVGFVVALAAGPGSYASYMAFAGSWPVQVVLAVLLFAFSFHLANGIRHLLWDAGIGLERGPARFSAKLVTVLAVLMTIGLLVLFHRHGGAP
jgi:succinate dehydrogenase / fumarate reductase cytochrome b subunit